jgi:poly-gamma-glutamate synthesis protein (capsule biosynthesis protein)
MVFVGDIMQHTSQLENALECGGDSSYDYSSYFKYTRPYLESADIAVANMEFTVGVRPYTGYPCFSAPESLAAEASKNGIGLFLTANNHICDKGRKGLDSTMAIYGRNGWKYTGIYPDSSSERINNPEIIDIKGIKVAFINFTFGTNGNRIPDGYVVNVADTASIAAALKRAAEDSADMIVALPHWGTEYSTSPCKVQTALEKFLYSHGVDIIIGSHPHVVEPVSVSRDSLTGSIKHITFFSLGNFISNMSAKYTRIGALAIVKVVKWDNGGGIEILQPEVHYLWCCKAGKLEKGYTVAPISYLLENCKSILPEEEYFKIESEWEQLGKELNLTYNK